MAKVCEICRKGPQAGSSIAPHSKAHTKRRFKPNLQKCRPRSLSVARREAGLERKLVISLSRKWQGRWYCTSCLKRLKRSHPKPATSD
ncbi:MAG: L28 family ribosomal protein [candidate division WWE3 bacterium]|nr:L28 family ribosomal protein [candidate division WWE3 bacterium]